MDKVIPPIYSLSGDEGDTTKKREGKRLNILLTGAGFLGSRLLDYILPIHNVTVVDRLDYGSAGIYPHLNHDNICFVDKDICDISNVNDFDAIIHLAALVGEPLCEKHPDEAKRVNVEGTKHLCDLAEDANVKFIFSSTCSNYGVTEGYANEETPLNPQGLYAETKVEAEKYIISNNHDYTILRFSTLYGCSYRMRLDLMVNQFTYDACVNQMIEVYSPNAYRPNIHVKDACYAILAVLLNPIDTQNKIYNVGGKESNMTKREIANIVTSLFVMPKAEVVEMDRGDKRDYKVDFSKIQSELGYITCFNIGGGVREVRELIGSYHPRALRMMNNVKGYNATGIHSII